MAHLRSRRADGAPGQHQRSFGRTRQPVRRSDIERLLGALQRCRGGHRTLQRQPLVELHGAPLAEKRSPRSRCKTFALYRSYAVSILHLVPQYFTPQVIMASDVVGAMCIRVGTPAIHTVKKPLPYSSIERLSSALRRCYGSLC